MSIFAALPQHWESLVHLSSEHVVNPLFTFLHVHENPVEFAEAGLITLLQIGIISLIFRPLEDILPAEEWADRKLTKIDRLYTLIMLLGLFPIFSYVVLTPIAHLFTSGAAAGADEAQGYSLKTLVPWFDHHRVLLVAVYYVVYDLLYYWMHRAQHLIPWWWALHSMHHSQRQMSCWTNDRGSYIDGVIQSLILATVGLVMGVDIADFAWLTLVSELVQNFSHVNTRIGFGRVLNKVLVDPLFHRVHHARFDKNSPIRHDCNFGQVFSIWDVIFGTAVFNAPIVPTGVSDPIIDADNDRGVVSMQWNTARRFWGAFWCRAGWKLGPVYFGEDFIPYSGKKKRRPLPSAPEMRDAVSAASPSGVGEELRRAAAGGE